MSDLQQLDRREIEIFGSRLSLIDEGEGPPILLGHGYLWDADMWAPQIKVLARRNRVIAPDMWGHGQSGPLPSGTQTLADLASQMVAVLDQLAIDRCVIIGLSMGGMWGAHIAASTPDRAAGLVILNSYLGREPLPTRTKYGALLDAIEWDGGFSREVAEAVVPLFFAPDIEDRRPGLRGALRARIASFHTEQIRQSIVPIGRLIFGREDALDALAGIQRPHLIVAGAADVPRPPEESIRMAQLLGSEPTIIAHCGHTSALEQEDEVNRILDEFLNKISWRD